MQAHIFFFMEDFSKSCCILGSHRVLNRKHHQCNDLVIKVLHWKCGGFIAFLLYSSCGISEKVLKSPSYLTFWEENLSNFDCLSFKLQACSFFFFLSTAHFQEPHSFSLFPHQQWKFHWMTELSEGRKEEGSTLSISNTRGKDYWIKIGNMSLRQAKHSFL